MRNLFALALLLSLIFGCSDEDAALSESILGTWNCQEEDLTPTVIYPTSSGDMIAETRWTLNFFENGTFSSIFKMSFTLQQQNLYCDLITLGKYATYRDSIALNPEQTDIYSYDPEFEAFLDSALINDIKRLETSLKLISKADVSGAILLLDGKSWRKV